MKSLILLSALSALSTAVPTTSRPSLVLQPRDTRSSSLSTSPCARYLSRIGVSTLSDVYYLDEACVASTAGLEDTDRVVIQLEDEQPLSLDHSGSALSRLVWLHLPKLENSDPTRFTPETSYDPSSSSSLAGSQIAFNAPLPVLPTRLASLPSNGDASEGSLHLLSSDPRVALEQLEFLTSHPSTALLTLVSIPFPSLSISSNARLAVEGDGPKFPEVPEKDVKRIESWLKNLEFEPLLSALLDGIKQKGIERDVKVLSGEDQSSLKEDERWVSRHSMSTGAISASKWLLSQMRSYDFTCTPHSFLNGFSSMLECIYNRSGKGLSEGNETVVLGAHYDSRGSFGFPTAPGADDDASGTSLVLAVARHIHLNRLIFSRKLVLALFAGEEQGLLGSSWYAKHLKEEKKEDVIWMLQVDMVGYRAPHEPPQLALPDLIGLPQAAYLVGNISTKYVPELVVGRTGACCSDHQSFVENGIASTWIFERNGPIADPCYHSSCDLSERIGYDFQQILAHVKVAFATLWNVGGGSVE
ncbi:M28 family metallopeptidase [Sporobolomyces salmoneus]|uniref:M28 family metallopeptidase n=1 Tax=Sporobolomyces salmoneus TaxID=183962 RepID=UPI00316E64BF